VQHLLESRKCIHLKLPSDLHADLRVFAFKKKISVQAIFEEFAQQVVSGNLHFEKCVDNLLERKKKKLLKKLSAQDNEEIYKYIATQGDGSNE
jgi:hypothetical protein